MKQQGHQYEKVLQRAVFLKEEKAQLKGESVFFGCAHFRNPYSEIVRIPERRTRWKGKLNSIFALCVDLSGMEPPQGLKGKLIGYECSQEPPQPRRGLITGAHRGDYGLLRGDVVCTLMEPFVTAERNDPKDGGR